MCHSHWCVRSIWDRSKSKAIWMWTLKCELRSIQDRSKRVWTLSQSELRSISDRFQLKSILVWTALYSTMNASIDWHSINVGVVLTLPQLVLADLWTPGENNLVVSVFTGEHSLKIGTVGIVKQLDTTHTSGWCMPALCHATVPCHFYFHQNKIAGVVCIQETKRLSPFAKLISGLLIFVQYCHFGLPLIVYLFIVG